MNQRLYNCAKCKKYSKKGLTKDEVFESAKVKGECGIIGANLLCKECKQKEIESMSHEQAHAELKTCGGCPVHCKK